MRQVVFVKIEEFRTATPTFNIFTGNSYGFSDKDVKKAMIVRRKLDLLDWSTLKLYA